MAAYLGALCDVVPVCKLGVSLLARAAVQRHGGGAPRGEVGDELVRGRLVVVVASTHLGAVRGGVVVGGEAKGVVQYAHISISMSMNLFLYVYLSIYTSINLSIYI